MATMNKRRVLIAVGLLAALLVGYKLCDRSRRGDSESAGESAGSSVPESERARIERAQARRAETLSAPRAALGGVVLDASTREPLAGAIVSMGRTSLDLGAQLNPGEAKSPIIVVTGDDGRFRIAALRAGELSVSASAPGYLPTSRDRIALASGEENESIELLLSRGGNELSGTVTDVGGGPIGGAYVRVQRISEGTLSTLFRAPVTAISDGEGRYSLSLADGTYFIEAGHADYVVVRRDTQMFGSSRTEDFELVPGATIEGRVLVAGTEEPVAGAVVTLSVRGGRITGAVFGAGAMTGPDGRFVLSGLRSGEVNLLAVARRYASRTPTTVVVGIAEHRTEVTLYVDAAYAISGFVVSREDNSVPIPRVMVGGYNIGRRSAAVTSDPSADDGFFEIVGVIPGAYTIAAASEGMLPEIANQTVEIVDKDIDGVIVELSQGYSIKGRVNPPVAAYVRLEVDMESFSLTAIPRMISSQLARTKADESGNFELTGLNSGKLTVVAEHVDHGAGRTAVDVKSPGLTGVVVELETTGSIAGTVLDASGKPVRRARVRAAGGESSALGFGSSFGDGNSAISDDKGDFKIRGLEPATYRLRVRRDGQTLSWAGASAAAAGGGSAKPIEVELAKSEEREGLELIVEATNETITGRVIDGKGDAVADAWVTLGPTSDEFSDFERRGGRGGRPGRGGESSAESDGGGDGVTIEVDDNLSSRMTPALSDGEGNFSFDGLRRGEYWVSATGPRGDQTGTVRPVATGTRVTIALESMGSAAGVVSSGGAPVTTYTLKVDGPRLVRLPVSSDTGAYSVERLPSGRYEFQIQSEAGRARQSVVIEGKPLRIDFEIEPYSEVTGQVIGAKTGKPLANRAVFAVSAGSDTDAIGEQLLTGDVPTTDGTGKFSVSRQGVGEATILIIDALAGISPIGQASVLLEQGKTVDAGVIYAVDEPLVASDLRGDLGLTVSTATFAKRPVAEGGDGASAPAGSAADDEFLWVSEVAEGGAAKAAGVEKGDRIALIDTIDLAVVGAAIGQYLLRPDRNGVGKMRALSIDRGGEPIVIEVTARVAAP